MNVALDDATTPPNRIYGAGVDMPRCEWSRRRTVSVEVVGLLVVVTRNEEQD